MVSISLVIGLLLSFFILFMSYKKIYREQLLISTDLLHNAESGINLLCADRSVMPYEARSIDLFGSGRDSVTLKYMPWGVFDVLVSDAVFKNKHERLIALSGNGIDASQKTALYISDLDRPVSVSGKTMLKGTCYIPKAGIKGAFVEGSSFTGEQIIYGTTRTSSDKLPDLDKDWLDRLAQTAQRSLDHELFERALMPADSLKRSFCDRTLWIEEEGALKIGRVSLQGNIIISSSKKISIGGDAMLKDVLVIAPYIEIAEGFKGNAHFIATDTIITGKKVDLAYPSSLVVINQRKNDTAPYLLVDEGSQVNGVLMVWKKEFDPRYQPRLMLNKEVFIKGQALCNGYTALNSCKVHGSVYANKLLLVTGSSVYENHLLNTEIDGTRLPDHFYGISFDKKQALSGVASWLY